MGKLRASTDREVAWLRSVVRSDVLLLSLLAMVVGLLAGAAGVVFREGVLLVQLAFYGTSLERLSVHTATLSWWHILIAPAVGGLIVGPLVHFLLPGRRAHGLADVIEASALRGGRLEVRTGIIAALANVLSIGAGASVGREGPAVHLGAAVASGIGTILRLPRTLARTLLGCGAAAAVAASFNAPIAGALFASEVVIGHYALNAFAPVVVASVVGTVVSRAHFGGYPAFILADFPEVSIWEFPAVTGLGILAGVTAALFLVAVKLAQEAGGRMPGPPWLRPAIGGLMVGMIAMPIPGVLGIGYGVTEAALANNLTLVTLVVVCGAKLVATSISLGFGFGGGVFSPSLVIGATLGGAYGVVATAVFPEFSSGPSAYAVIGMGAVAASVLGAPISTTLIVFEMTGDYSLTMAVMLATVVSAAVYRHLAGQSFFHWQLEQRGLDLHGGFEAALLRGIRVGSTMSVDCDVIHPQAGLEEIRAALQRSRSGELFVVDPEAQTLIGTLTLADLSEAAYDHALDDLVNAQDAARRNPPHLFADDHLETALKLFRSSGETQIAVIRERGGRRFIGCLIEREAMIAYTRALLETRRAERG
jgi:CIC family chloride channel protein